MLLKCLYVCGVLFSYNVSGENVSTSASTTTTQNSSGDKGESYRMPGYLIGVILLSILLGVVLTYKIYKHISTKQLRMPCCLEGPRPSVLQRSDTNRPLIRSGSNSSGGRDGSIYKHRNQRGADSV